MRTSEPPRICSRWGPFQGDFSGRHRRVVVASVERDCPRVGRDLRGDSPRRRRLVLPRDLFTGYLGVSDLDHVLLALGAVGALTPELKAILLTSAPAASTATRRGPRSRRQGARREDFHHELHVVLVRSDAVGGVSPISNYGEPAAPSTKSLPRITRYVPTSSASVTVTGRTIISAAAGGPATPVSRLTSCVTPNSSSSAAT